MQRPELASLLGRSLLIASFEQDKDGKQRYWEVRTRGPAGSRFHPGGYYLLPVACGTAILAEDACETGSSAAFASR